MVSSEEAHLGTLKNYILFGRPAVRSTEKAVQLQGEEHAHGGGGGGMPNQVQKCAGKRRTL